MWHSRCGPVNLGGESEENTHSGYRGKMLGCLGIAIVPFIRHLCNLFKNRAE